jgi:hypothetical protein
MTDTNPNPPVEQTPPPASAPVQEAPKGIMDAMAQLDAGVAAADKAAASHAPGPAKGAPQPPPADKTDAPAVAAPKDEPIVEPAWEKAPKNLKNAHFKFVRETGEKTSKLESKIKELEGKAIQTPADEKKIKEYEDRIAAYEKQVSDRDQALIESDYSRSAEFKREYIDKANTKYAQAISVVKTLQITNAEGESRQATEADFRALLRLEPAAQDAILDQFGVSKNRVLSYINQLQSIEEAGTEAIAKSREKAVEKSKQQQAEFGNRSNEFKNITTSAIEELVKARPEHFLPDPANPEATKIFENGLKFYDNTVENNGNLSVKELAERAVIMRYGFAAYARLAHVDKQKTAKITALETELAKYRKSSPGSAAPTGGERGTPEPKKVMSIMEAARAFDT